MNAVTIERHTKRCLDDLVPLDVRQVDRKRLSSIEPAKRITTATLVQVAKTGGAMAKQRPKSSYDWSPEETLYQKPAVNSVRRCHSNY